MTLRAMIVDDFTGLCYPATNIKQTQQKTITNRQLITQSTGIKTNLNEKEI